MDSTCGTLVYQAPEQMAGSKVYGKPVDIWAIGFIMYELIKGKHPLWKKGDDNKMYMRKAQEFDTSKLKFGSRFNKFNQSLIEKLCNPKASLRYTTEQALQHPWITRNFETVIPRNHFEQNMYLNDAEEKLRRVFNMMFALQTLNQEVKNGAKEKVEQESQKLYDAKKIKFQINSSLMMDKIYREAKSQHALWARKKSFGLLNLSSSRKKDTDQLS
jgi:serine/threonine protein kinase